MPLCTKVLCRRSTAAASPLQRRRPCSVTGAQSATDHSAHGTRLRAGALTLTHLRGSTDYRSCQHLAQRSVLTQLNGSPKTSVNTAVNTVLTHAPGKTRVYLQKTGYTREIPGSASMPRAPYSQGHCANCSAHRLLKYAHRTMCCRYACLKAAAAKRRARHADGSADDAVAMCSASRSWRCLACTSAIPISSSQRSSATSWLLPTRPYATSRADRSKRTSACTGFCDMRLFELEAICENCLARSR